MRPFDDLVLQANLVNRFPKIDGSYIVDPMERSIYIQGHGH